jgi:hypothetical protein
VVTGGPWKLGLSQPFLPVILWCDDFTFIHSVIASAAKQSNGALWIASLRSQ